MYHVPIPWSWCVCACAYLCALGSFVSRRNILFTHGPVKIYLHTASCTTRSKFIYRLPHTIFFFIFFLTVKKIYYIRIGVFKFHKKKTTPRIGLYSKCLYNLKSIGKQLFYSIYYATVERAVPLKRFLNLYSIIENLNKILLVISKCSIIIIMKRISSNKISANHDLLNLA